MSNEQPQRVIVTPTKSMGVAILLTVLFGPLGMLYATVPGALVMIGISLALLLLSVFTFGFGLVLFIFVWPATIIWAAMATKSYNEKLLAGQRSY